MVICSDIRPLYKAGYSHVESCSYATLTPAMRTYQQIEKMLFITFLDK